MKHTRGIRTGSGAVGQTMTRWIMAVALLGCGLSFSEGCGESTPPAEESEAIQAVPAESEEVQAEEDLEEEPADELGEPVPLDEMDRPALEAACFAGQNAACDRLGH